MAMVPARAQSASLGRLFLVIGSASTSAHAARPILFHGITRCSCSLCEDVVNSVTFLLGPELRPQQVYLDS
eukprot:scaffold163387_cov30-Tisochrysis_lutea.AAC.1